MVKFVKFLLIVVVLITIGFCGWWHFLTPQPPSFNGQIRYLKDTLAFQSRNFTRPPRLDKKNTEQIAQEDILYWLPTAQQGNFVAQIYIAKYLFAQGQTNPVTYPRAVEYLLPSAQIGIPIAQNALGVAYRHGLGVKQDKVEAYKWFSLAAKRGLDIAENNLLEISRELNASMIEEGRNRAILWTPAS